MDLAPAVAYARVSTGKKGEKDQAKKSSKKDQENSFEAQQKYFLTQASNLGYNLVKSCGNNGIYADKGISGKSIFRRDEFNKMIEDAKNGEFQWIIVKDIKRYARDVVTLQDTVRELRRSKVYVHFLHESIKTNDFTEEVMMNVLSSLAQNELQHLSKSIQFGMRQAQRDKKWTSQPPYGYDRINAYLKVNENESKIVIDVFNMYINHKMSLNKIVQYLNDNNIFSKRGSTWTSSAIKYMLKNPIYTGLQIGHKVECTDIYNNTVEKMDSSEWIKNYIEELRIISDTTFKLAQEELQERANLYNQGQRYSTVNILSNILRCGNCGSTMKRFERTGNHTAFYMCRNHHNTKVCKFSNYVRQDKMLEYIKNEFKNFEFKWDGYVGAESIKELYEFYIENNLNDQLLNELPFIQEKISKLETRVNNLIDMRADGDITKEQYLERKKQIEIEIEPLLKQRNKIENINSEREKVWRIYEQFVKTIKEFNLENFDNSDLRKIIKKITVTTEDKETKYLITWNNGLDKDFGKIEDDFHDEMIADTYSYNIEDENYEL